MTNLTDLQKGILEIVLKNSERNQVTRYSELEDVLQTSKKELQEQCKILRDEKLIYLEMAWNEDDGMFHGCGWMITPKRKVDTRKLLGVNKMKVNTNVGTTYHEKYGWKCPNCLFLIGYKAEICLFCKIELEWE